MQINLKQKINKIIICFQKIVSNNQINKTNRNNSNSKHSNSLQFLLKSSKNNIRFVKNMAMKEFYHL